MSVTTAGIRLPDSLTDVVAATALTFKLSKVDIYSNSWAVPSDGKTLDGPGRLTNRKIEKGITEVGETLRPRIVYSVSCLYRHLAF